MVGQEIASSRDNGEPLRDHSDAYSPWPSPHHREDNDYRVSSPVRHCEDNIIGARESGFHGSSSLSQAPVDFEQVRFGSAMYVAGSLPCIIRTSFS